MACFMLNVVPGRFYQVAKREEVADRTLRKTWLNSWFVDRVLDTEGKVQHT